MLIHISRSTACLYWFGETFCEFTIKHLSRTVCSWRLPADFFFFFKFKCCIPKPVNCAETDHANSLTMSFLSTLLTQRSKRRNGKRHDLFKKNEISSLLWKDWVNIHRNKTKLFTNLSQKEMQSDQEKKLNRNCYQWKMFY